MDLQGQYFLKAAEAYREKEYKYCLILLRKLDLNDYKTVSLLVNCSYDYWKATCFSMVASRSVSRATSRPGSAIPKVVNPQSIGQLMSAKENINADFELVLTTIKESFTKLLANVKVVPIKQYDYIRLTHVYLVEGSLHGALQILQLASARGFLEDPLVILQSWSIMKRISNERDALGAMTFLVSTLVIEASQRKRTSNSRHGGRIKQDRPTTGTMNTTNKSLFSTALMLIDSNNAPVNNKQLFVSESDLPLEYLYLHCAAFIHRQAIKCKGDSKAYNKHLGELAAVLSEGYFITHQVINEDVQSLNAWFNDPSLWYDMAVKLDIHTPYVLLAQDSYWEAYVRSPLEELAIVAYVNSLIRNNCKKEVPELLAQAMEVCPWNLFVRNALYELDCELLTDPAERHWAEMFINDDKFAVMVQSTVRGWRLRSHWDTVYQRIFTRKEKYQSRKAMAIRKYLDIWRGHQYLVFRNWKIFVEEYKAQKLHCSSMIQAHWRGRMWRIWYAWYRQRIAMANFTYLIAYQKIRDVRRVERFQHWYNMHRQLVKRRSADIITNVLYMNGYSRVLRNGMDFLITVIRVKRKYMYRRIMHFWHQKMSEKRTSRARTTIRFFIRNVFARQGMAEKEEQMARVADIINAKANVDFKKNNLPLLREKWGIWYRSYQRIAHANMIDRLASQLALLFFHYRGREMRRAQRVRVEAQLAFVRSAWYHRVFNIFEPWRLHAGAFKIQRAMRVRRAARIYKRLLHINRTVEVMQESKMVEMKKRVLWRWHRYNYLLHREKIRAARVIVKLFRLIITRGTVRRKCASKVSIGKLIDKIHSSHFRMCVRRLRTATVYAARFIVLNKMAHALRKGVLRNAYYVWAHFLSAQKVCDRLVYCRATRPLELKYWVGSACAVKISPLQAPAMDWSGCTDLIKPTALSLGFGFIGASLPPNVFSPTSAAFSTQLKRLLDESLPKEVRYKPFEEYVPLRSVALLDVEKVVAAKAFKTWIATYRLRQRYLRSVSNTVSARIVGNARTIALVRLAAAFGIQNVYRSFHARRVFCAELACRRRQQEMSWVLSERHRRRATEAVWMELKTVQQRIRKAVICIQSFVRLCFAARKYEFILARHVEQTKRCDAVGLRRDQAMLKVFMHRWEEQYCQAAHNSLHMSRETTSVLKKKRSNQDEVLGVGGGVGDGGMQQQVSHYAVGNAARTAAIMRLQNKANANLKYSKSTDTLPGTSAAELGILNKTHTSTRRISRDIGSFQSEECRQHLLRLNQTGVFIFDCAGTPADATAQLRNTKKLTSRKSASTLREEAPLHPQLTNEELRFCLQNAEAVFCQQTRKAPLRSVVENFGGSKLALIGGELTANTIATMLFDFLRESTYTEAQSAAVPLNSVVEVGSSEVVVVRKQPLILHMSGIRMTVSARLALIRSIADISQPISENVEPHTQWQAQCTEPRSRVCELSVDSDSLGRLGTAVLLRSLQVLFSCFKRFDRCNIYDGPQIYTFH